MDQFSKEIVQTYELNMSMEALQLIADKKYDSVLSSELSKFLKYLKSVDYSIESMKLAETFSKTHKKLMKYQKFVKE